jgi:hypothetical protein
VVVRQGHGRIGLADFAGVLDDVAAGLLVVALGVEVDVEAEVGDAEAELAGTRLRQWCIKWPNSWKMVSTSRWVSSAG